MNYDQSLRQQNPLHVITVGYDPFVQSVYYQTHVCHFVMRSTTFTECSIKLFNTDASLVLSGLRSESLKFPALRDDMGLLEYSRNN